MPTGTLPKNNRFINLSGNRYGRLTVVEYSHKISHCYWRCICDCGKEKTVRMDALLNGKTKSCGCLAKETGRSKVGKYRSPLGHTAMLIAFGKYKDSALKRKIPFEITKEQFRYLVDQDCYYCEESASNYVSRNDINGGVAINGLDRVDSKKGYTLDNVVPCCQFCNHAKMEKTEEEYVGWLERVRGRPLISILEMAHARWQSS